MPWLIVPSRIHENITLLLSRRILEAAGWSKEGTDGAVTVTLVTHDTG
jgi:hypothetical protein